MKRLKKFGAVLGVAAGLYILMPFAVFDISSVATPHDEENYEGRMVVIGPKPWWWVPGAARHWDIPGGFDYDPNSWPFVVWKPFCIAYDKLHGYALPAKWR